MLSGVFFLIFLVGVLMVVAWSVKMDRRPSGARTSGLLAMREPEAGADAVADRKPPQR